jgi:hypothetical protein
MAEYMTVLEKVDPTRQIAQYFSPEEQQESNATLLVGAFHTPTDGTSIKNLYNGLGEYCEGGALKLKYVVEQILQIPRGIYPSRAKESNPNPTNIIEAVGLALLVYKVREPNSGTIFRMNWNDHIQLWLIEDVLNNNKKRILEDLSRRREI